MLNDFINQIYGWKGFLISPSTDAIRDRKELAKGMNQLKMHAGITGCTLSIFSTMGLIASRRYPLIGAVIATVGATGVIGSREVFIISDNTEAIMDAGFVNRVQASWSNQLLVNSLLQRTWLISPLFETAIVRSLDATERKARAIA